MRSAFGHGSLYRRLNCGRADRNTGKIPGIATAAWIKLQWIFSDLKMEFKCPQN